MRDDFEVGRENDSPYIFRLRQVTTWPFQRDYVMREVMSVSKLSINLILEWTTLLTVSW